MPALLSRVERSQSGGTSEPDDPLRGQALRLPEAHGLRILAEPELRIAGEDRDPELV